MTVDSEGEKRATLHRVLLVVPMPHPRTHSGGAVRSKPSVDEDALPVIGFQRDRGKVGGRGAGRPKSVRHLSTESAADFKATKGFHPTVGQPKPTDNNRRPERVSSVWAP